ncbi:response regulator transcription factor [Niveibacterium umoris]|uniref:DNA-binding NarL/FixJ family response regulator n=1 Tax=Niveibacterium umoris TaxID=1193620 RepID=A0A840BTE0_9RHOO|nr:response regulator transcription factor [Niveibacterium umoris]MBB4014788.1 DNA-binding NarL/FixJ family response regulator [Niveibacterium umoris]
MSEAAASVRILLVDDHPLVRDGVRARLETVPGFAVVAEAGTATEALTQAEIHTPDIALMDVGLPGTSGVELARMCHERFPALRIVMLTMHDQPQVVVEAFRAGARGYVLKDSPAQEIVAAIQTVMAGRRYYSAGVADALAHGAAPEPLLSVREKEVLAFIAEGLSSKEIAQRLDLSVRTVETHRLNIKRKLELDGSAALARFAVERKWTGL